MVYHDKMIVNLTLDDTYKNEEWGYSVYRIVCDRGVSAAALAMQMPHGHAIYAVCEHIKVTYDMHNNGMMHFHLPI